MMHPSLKGDELKHVKSPSDCCLRCSLSAACKSWSWQGGIENCWLWCKLPTQKEARAGFASGPTEVGAPAKSRFKFWAGEVSLQILNRREGRVVGRKAAGCRLELPSSSSAPCTIIMTACLCTIVMTAD